MTTTSKLYGWSKSISQIPVKSMSKMTNGNNATRMGHHSNATINVEESKYTIWMELQDLKSCVYSELASNICEDKMTEVPLEHPIRKIGKYKEIKHIQRTMRFESRPLQAIYRSLEPVVVPTKNEERLNPVASTSSVWNQSISIFSILTEI